MELSSVAPKEFGANGGVDITLNGNGFGKTPDGFEVKILMTTSEFACHTKSWSKNQIVCTTSELDIGQGIFAVRAIQDIRKRKYPLHMFFLEK